MEDKDNKDNKYQYFSPYHNIDIKNINENLKNKYSNIEINEN